MIHSVSIENYFSISSEQKICFKISKGIKDTDSWARDFDKMSNTNIPTHIGIFGPNASGKTTLIKAVVTACFFIVHSFSWNNDNDVRYLSTLQPYRNMKWKNKPTKIKLEFDLPTGEEGSNEKTLFSYELHISHSSKSEFEKTVLYESLSYKPNFRFTRLFERKNGNFEFSKKFDMPNGDLLAKNIRINASVISTFAQFNHKVSTHICNLIKTLSTNINPDGFRNVMDTQHVFSFYKNNPEYLSGLNEQIERMDLGLKSMKIDDLNSGLLYAKCEHIGLDGYIRWHEESSGTRSFINIFPLIYTALQVGGVVIIDEIDTDLHPLILPEIMTWFGNKETNRLGAQIIFTAHNSIVMDHLERQQVVLTDKTSDNATIFYKASDISGLRRTPSLMKKYLGGELGAIPQIG